MLRLRAMVEFLLSPLSRAISGAVLLREAARTSRQWQTYAARTAFSGVLMGVLLFGMWGAVEATRTAAADTADLGQLGRWLFSGFSVAQILLSLLIAPLVSANAIIEETDERTMEMLVLTPLSPGQILAAKIVSRILLLVTLVFGALPIMALVVNLGGVSTVEVLAVTAHTLTTVVVLSALGAFFALFTRSPALATLASASYAVPFFGLLPMAYVICTGRPEHASHFSTFAASFATDWTALVTPLSYVPSLVVLFAVATPLFRLRVSNADFRHAFSEDVWHTRTWLTFTGLWFAACCFTIPFAAPISWATKSSATAAGQLGGAVAEAWLWLLFCAMCGIGTWAFLRVGMDVVDGIDGIFSGTGLGPQHERASKTVGRWPIWWREARPTAWVSTAAPMFVTWALVMLAVFQTGWWIVPGGLLAIGALNGMAAILFAGWLASRSISEERRRGSLEILLATTLSSFEITIGKLAGAAMPTAPLLLLSLPLFALGVPHLAMLNNADQSWWWLSLRGVMSWMWLVPIWLLAIVVSMTVTTRSSRPQSSFAVVAITAIVLYGVPSVAAHALPDSRWVTIPARIIAPPLAGAFSPIELVLSLLITTTAAIFLLARYILKMRTWVGALIALLALLLASSPATAQDPGDPSAEDEVTRLEQLNQMRMRAYPLADGITREGAFTSLYVIVDNAGLGTTGTLSLVERAPAVDGEASVQTTFTRSIELPEGTRKEVVLLFRAGLGDADRQLDLITREGRVAHASFLTRPASAADVTIGIIGTDPLGLPAILRETSKDRVPGRGTRPLVDNDRMVRTGLILAPSMPEHAAGYGALDWVVWPSADPSQLTHGQVAALLAWVADGGHLLVLVSDTWRQVADSPLGLALPVEMTAQQDAEVDNLRTLLGMKRGEPVPIARSTLRPRGDRLEGQVVRAATQDNAPLWVSSRYGLGSLHVVTAELRSELRGHESAWRRLLTLPTPSGYAGDLLARESDAAALAAMLHLDSPVQTPENIYDTRSPDASWEATIRDHLDDIPGVSPLPLSWLATFAAIYLLAIGPLDYIVLRLAGRQPLTWITFPFLILVFSAASLAMTQYTKGSQAVVVRVEVVDLLSGTGLARGSTWLSVFSTRKTTLTLTSGYDDAVMTPLLEPGFQNDPTMRAGAGPGSLSYGAETWTLAYARSDWTAPLQPLTVSEDTRGATLRNDLPFDLDEVGLMIPDSSSDGAHLLRLGPLAAGQSVSLSVDAEPETFPNSLIGEDPLGWASHHFHGEFPSSRGGIAVHRQPVFIGVAKGKTLEPVTLSGLSPIEQPFFIVRQPLDASDVTSAPSTPEQDDVTPSTPEPDEVLPAPSAPMIAPTGTAGDPIILGTLDRSLLDEVVKRHMNQIRYCYQRELVKNSSIGGKIVIKFTIARDGTVSSASTKSSTMGNTPVENCIVSRFLRMQFPEPKGGGIVIVSYPFLFTPGTP